MKKDKIEEKIDREKKVIPMQKLIDKLKKSLFQIESICNVNLKRKKKSISSLNIGLKN